MAHFGAERRRTPRVESMPDESLSLDVSLPVEILDISIAGVQLASNTELKLGARGTLRASVGARSVSVDLEVRRVAVDTRPARGAGVRYRIGAVFSGMTPEQRVVLEQLLGTEPS